MDACSFPEIECSTPKVFLKNVKRLRYEHLCSQARPKESHPFLYRNLALCRCVQIRGCFSNREGKTSQPRPLLVGVNVPFSSSTCTITTLHALQYVLVLFLCTQQSDNKYLHRQLFRPGASQF